tara:strand:+ start:991 stop:1341 length:351 start_codon:yes stop_codon:yes gene_type:complete
MGWRDILKNESVKKLVHDALALHPVAYLDYKDNYTLEEIEELASIYKEELKRDRLDEFDVDYLNEGIRLLERAKEMLGDTFEKEAGGVSFGGHGSNPALFNIRYGKKRRKKDDERN